MPLSNIYPTTLKVIVILSGMHYKDLLFTAIQVPLFTHSSSLVVEVYLKSTLDERHQEKLWMMGCYIHFSALSYLNDERSNSESAYSFLDVALCFSNRFYFFPVNT